MPRTAVVILIVLTAVFATLAGTVAQDASPVTEATPTEGCDVAPRDEEELISLNATATSGGATPVAINPMEMPNGEPVDATTLNALDETLIEVSACAETGDLAKLLALYSDAYVAGIALAPEPVPIVPGHAHEHAGGLVGTPGAESGVEPRLESAVKLPDGRIAARVSASGLEGTADIVIFVEERGMWVIDEVHEALPQGAVGGDLPFPVQAAVAAAAAELGVPAESITVVSDESVEWPDTSLGCPKEGEFYAQVITPGYLVILSIDGKELEYHTDSVDRAIHCEPE
jgi:hypothetical protein